MKRKIRKTELTILVLAIAILIIINYNYLGNLLSNILENQIKTLGYFGVFISVFILELIPQPFISALVPFTTGLLFGLNLQNLILMMIVGYLTSNYLAYFIGKYYADSIAKFLISKKNYEKSLKWFEKYGKTAITILALTPLPYLPVLGGIFKMTPHEFTLYAVIPRLFHFLVYSYLILLII